MPSHDEVTAPTSALTELQRRRLRILSGVTLYVVGILTGFQWGTER